MTVFADLSLDEATSAASGNGLRLRFGPFNVNLRTRLRRLLAQQQRLYPRAPLLPKDTVFHYQLMVQRAHKMRSWLRPQVRFRWDTYAPLELYPISHAYPMFEWGLNWCIAMTGHRYLMLHAAVLERHGQALILPAMPGSGKSTLCAALAHRGWRMLTDEMGLLRPEDGRIVPLPRAIPLKNDAIDIARAFAPDAVFGLAFDNTKKGTIAHMAPPDQAIERQQETAKPRWIIFPKFQKNAAFALSSESQGQAFTRLAHNSFNYELLAETSFLALGKLVKQCACYASTHSDLEVACEALTELADGTPFDN